MRWTDDVAKAVGEKREARASHVHRTTEKGRGSTNNSKSMVAREWYIKMELGRNGEGKERSMIKDSNAKLITAQDELMG